VVGAASAQVSLSGGFAVAMQTKVGDTDGYFHITDADINFKASEDLGGGLTVSAGLGISNEANRGGNPGIENNSLALSGGFGTISYADVLSGKAKMGGASLETDLSDYTGGYAYVENFTYTSPDVGGGWKFFLQWAKGRAATGATSDANNSLKLKDADQSIGVTGSMAGANIYLDNNTSNSAEGWDLRVTYPMAAATIVARTSKDKWTEFGISVPMGALTYTANTISNKGTTTKKASAFGITYAMRKQTSLTFGYGSGNGGSTATHGSNYRLQLAKKF
jgi:hypothetical protein